MQVLFVGNSYTYYHQLPSLFQTLSESGGYSVETAMAAEGGWTLAQHRDAAETRALIGTRPWQYVVLQEQSLSPALPERLGQLTRPAAQALANQIRQQGAQPLLFMTWGYRDGSPKAGLGNYRTMQAQLERGYRTLAQELAAPLVPVGLAWQRALDTVPQLPLWDEDGSHPSLAGSYLAACVLYGVIHRSSPEGLAYTAGLSLVTGEALQRAAAQAVVAETAIAH